MIYDNLEYKAKYNPKNKVIISFINGARCEIKGPLSQEYQVKFYNDDTSELIWEDTIKNNMWTAPSYKSFIKWRIEIWENGNQTHKHILDLTNKKVYIHLDSKSIGDTIAWFPYVEEFRKKHNCKVVCSTFHNGWFESQYPQIQFTHPDAQVEHIYAGYGIGWYYEEDKIRTANHLYDFKFQPLQKTATDILGLEFKELKPKIKTVPPTPIKEKYVTLSIQSTCQAKYWNYKKGWQQIVDFITKQGYKVVLTDKHKIFGIAGFMNESPTGVIDYTNKSLDEILSIIKNAHFHLGVSSGLPWLAWALNTPVLMVSSFTRPWFEFQSNCTRIYNDTPTSGYFNTHKLDPSNWNWYPFKEIKSIEDWYKIETITPEQVINGIKQLL